MQNYARSKLMSKQPRSNYKLITIILAIVLSSGYTLEVTTPGGMEFEFHKETSKLTEFLL